MKPEDVLSKMLALVEDPEGIIEAVTEEPLMNAGGELPVKRTPSVSLPKAEKSSYATLKSLRARHYTIIAMHISGSTNNEIAKEVGVTPSTVTKTLKSPLAADLIQKAMGQHIDEAIGIKDKLEELAGIGVSRLEDILVNDPDNKTALGAIKTVLEYVQSKAVQKTENLSMTVTPADIVEMRRRAAEIKPPNLIQDADFEEVPSSS